MIDQFLGDESLGTTGQGDIPVGGGDVGDKVVADLVGREQRGPIAEAGLGEDSFSRGEVDRGALVLDLGLSIGRLPGGVRVGSEQSDGDENETTKHQASKGVAYGASKPTGMGGKLA